MKDELAEFRREARFLSLKLRFIDKAKNFARGKWGIEDTN